MVTISISGLPGNVAAGEQGEKIVTKDSLLKNSARDIDHSFYRGLTPLATMVLADETEISKRFENGGLPAAGNSSDHVYLCVEYELDQQVIEEDSAMERIKIENNRLKTEVRTLKEATASGTTAGTSKPKAGTDEKKGMLTKFKDFFYTSSKGGEEKKLNWKTVVPTVGLGLGAVAAVAGAGVSMGVLGPEEKNMSGIAKAGIAAATLAGVGAAGYYGYKNYKAGKDDSEVDDADREVSLGGSGKSKKRHKSKDKKTEKGSNTMLLIFGGLAVLAVLAFLFLGKTEEKSASPLEGDELV